MFFQYNQADVEALKAKDARLKEVIESIPNPKYKIEPDLFKALVYCAVAYQCPAAAAERNYRLLSAQTAITPDSLAGIQREKIQECGMTRRKSVYIQRLAVSVLEGELDLERIKNAPDEEAVRILTRLPGIGVWTAEMLLIFSLNRINVFSGYDKTLKSALCRLYHHRELSEKMFLRYRKRFSPYGTLAAFYLWDLERLQKL